MYLAKALSERFMNWGGGGCVCVGQIFVLAMTDWANWPLPYGCTIIVIESYILMSAFTPIKSDKCTLRIKGWLFPSWL